MKKNKRRSKKGNHERKYVPAHPLRDGTWPKSEYREARLAPVVELWKI